MTMYEVFSRKQAYSDVTRTTDIIYMIRSGMRPAFDPDPAYLAYSFPREIVLRGWSEDPAERPTMDNVISLISSELLSR